MRLKEIRTHLRSNIPDADTGVSRSYYGDDCVCVSTRFRLSEVRRQMDLLGYVEIQSDIRGSRHNWQHVMQWEPKSAGRDPEVPPAPTAPAAPAAPTAPAVNRHNVATLANRLAGESRNGGAPKLSTESGADTLAAWLQWNDPNGIWTAELAAKEGADPLTLDAAWDAVAAVLLGVDDGDETADPAPHVARIKATQSPITAAALAVEIYSKMDPESCEAFLAALKAEVPPVFSHEAFPIGCPVIALGQKPEFDAYGKVVAHRRLGLIIRWTSHTGRTEDNFYSFADLNADAANGRVAFTNG